jgi:hypothetical protein
MIKMVMIAINFMMAQTRRTRRKCARVRTGKRTAPAATTEEIAKTKKKAKRTKRRTKRTFGTARRKTKILPSMAARMYPPRRQQEASQQQPTCEGRTRLRPKCLLPGQVFHSCSLS